VGERRDIDNAVRIRIRGLREKVLLEEMFREPAMRIRYASKYAASFNASKNAMGMDWAIRRYDFAGLKQAEQDSLLAWAERENRPEYVEALQMLEQIVSDRRDLRFRLLMLDEALLRGIEFSGVPADIESVAEALKRNDKERQREQLHLLTLAYRRFSTSYLPNTDRKIAKVMLREYRRLVPAHSQVAYLGVIDRKFKGDVERFMDHLFVNSIYGGAANFNTFIQKPSARVLEQDPMIVFAKAMQEEKRRLASALSELDVDFATERRTYMRGLLEMYGDSVGFPDANSSIRLTYGQVKGSVRATASITSVGRAWTGLWRRRMRRIESLWFRKG
jgi:hypothetical protein